MITLRLNPATITPPNHHRHLSLKPKPIMEDDIHAEMEAVSRALRRWRRTITSNTALAHSSRMRKASSVESGGGGGNFLANGPSHATNKGSSQTGGKKTKTESQRQRINRHNNAVGMKVRTQISYWTINCWGVSLHFPTHSPRDCLKMPVPWWSFVIFTCFYLSLPIFWVSEKSHVNKTKFSQGLLFRNSGSIHWHLFGGQA